MGHIAIPMVEIVRGNMQSAIPSGVTSQTLGSSSAASSSREVPSEAEPDIFAAARQGNFEQVQALIEWGYASAKDRDEQDLTPFTGVRTGTLSTVPEEEQQAMNDRVKTCKYLIEQGTADVNALGGNIPATPLQWAARKGLVKIIDLLIQHARLDIDVKDHSGLTPLHWAARQGDEVSMQILLKYGANPKAVDHDGLTALHWAARGAASGGNRSCISLLLEAGADIRANDKGEHTVQEMADEAAWDTVVDGMRIRRPLSE
ncbi:ankyrin repeat-containing domain protein, partial [Russula aff. rugulosa BPL654]